MEFVETTQEKFKRFKKEDKKNCRHPTPIDNIILGCDTCKRCKDHEPNEFGLYTCTDCGTTKEDVKIKVKWRER